VVGYYLFLHHILTKKEQRRRKRQIPDKMNRQYLKWQTDTSSNSYSVFKRYKQQFLFSIQAHGLGTFLSSSVTFGAA